MIRIILRAVALLGIAVAVIVVGSIAAMVAPLFISTPVGDLPAVRAAGQEVVEALLAEDEARWAARVAPDAYPEDHAALRSYLREYQRLMPACRGIGVEHLAGPVSGGRNSASYKARFSTACLARGSSPCDTIGLGMVRVDGRWYVKTIDRGDCDVDP